MTVKADINKTIKRDAEDYVKLKRELELYKTGKIRELIIEYYRLLEQYEST